MEIKRPLPIPNLLFRSRRHGRTMLTVSLLLRNSRTRGIQVRVSHALLDVINIVVFGDLGGDILFFSAFFFHCFVIIDGVEAICCGGATESLLEVLAALSFFFLSVDCVADVKDLALVDGAWAAEVHPPCTW
jgi:hypothetical protein